MAKKELNGDLLSGGALSAEDKKVSKEAKKAAKQAAKQKKITEKNNAKRAQIKEEIDKLKAQRAEETDEAKIKALDASIKKLSDKYASVGASSKGISKQNAKIIKSVVCAVVVVALLATYVCTGAVRKGFISYTGLPSKTLTAVTISNGDDKYRVKVDTYNFYFAMKYNEISSQLSMYEQYGLSAEQTGLNVDLTKTLSSQTYTDKDGNTMSWSKHMQDLVIEAIESTYTYYLAAVKANDGKEPEITDEQKEEIEETITNYTQQANKYGYTVSGYLVQAMGRGVTEKVFTRELTRQYIAQNYQQSLVDAEKREYTADDINAYKDENLESLESVDIRIFECANEDDAKAFKKALNADGSNFAELCSKYSEDKFDKEAYKDSAYSTFIGATRQDLQNGYAIGVAEEHEHDENEEQEHSYPGLDWLFSKDRKAGDSYQDSTTVVSIIAPVSLSDRKTVNVRHILIQPDKDANDQTSVDDEKWASAYKEAKKILAEYKKGDKTEEAFAELAKEHSADGNASEGGIYENVYTGRMVNPFSAWIFDNSRKPGDTGIVKTQFGYHIMYFVGDGEQKDWEYKASTALANSEGSSEIEKLAEDYTAKVNWFGSRYFEKDIDISN